MRVARVVDDVASSRLHNETAAPLCKHAKPALASKSRHERLGIGESNLPCICAAALTSPLKM